MKFIEESIFKFDSVRYGTYATLAVSIFNLVLQEVYNAQILPQPWQTVASMLLVLLATMVGKKKYQPELHIQSVAALPNKEDNLKTLFAILRKLAGGSLSQQQVNKINDLIESFKAKSTSNATSKAGIEFICSAEGLRLTAYNDGVGIWTIGYGTTVYPDGTKVKKGDRCTLDQAKGFMAHDLLAFEKAVNNAVNVPLNQNQFDALVSLAYNIGINAFKNSTLVKLLNASNYESAAEQFLVWNKAGGKVLQGLVNRRNAERSLFLKK